MAIKLCMEPGCQNPHLAKGLCSKHYQRKYTPHKICTLPGCTKTLKAQGLCTGHWRRAKLYGDPNYRVSQEHCDVVGCIRPHSDYGLCTHHLYQLYQNSDHKKQRSTSPKSRYTDSKNYAKHKGLLWTIPFDIFCGLITTPCVYCNELILGTKTGLDRINNDLGYSVDNVVPCCKYCNAIKSDKFTVEEFKEFSKLKMFGEIRNRLKQRLNNRRNKTTRSDKDNDNLTNKGNITNMSLNGK